MRPSFKLFVSTASIALCVFGASTAQAAGTTQGTDITNTASVAYNISGSAQTPITGSNTFKVDRKVNLTVAEVGNVTTQVFAGQVRAVTTFSVTNNSNDVIDIGLSIVQSATGTAAKHGGTDNFDITTASTYVDTNGNGVFDYGTDQQVTYLDEVAADASRTVFIVGDIPSGQANGSISNVNLEGTANAGGTAGTQGAVLTNSTGANNNMTVETVLADAAGTVDAARDGKHSAADDYTVNSSNAVTVVKNAYVISDPLNGTSNPKMIPGATVQYCITVTNPVGLGQTLTNLTISDPLPSQTTYVASSLMINATSGTPCSGGSAGGSFASNTATWTVGNLAAGVSATMLFQVTIN